MVGWGGMNHYNGNANSGRERGHDTIVAIDYQSSKKWTIPFQNTTIPIPRGYHDSMGQGEDVVVGCLDAGVKSII